MHAHIYWLFQDNDYKYITYKNQFVLFNNGLVIESKYVSSGVLQQIITSIYIYHQVYVYMIGNISN